MCSFFRKRTWRTLCCATAVLTLDRIYLRHVRVTGNTVIACATCCVDIRDSERLHVQLQFFSVSCTCNCVKRQFKISIGAPLPTPCIVHIPYSCMFNLTGHIIVQKERPSHHLQLASHNCDLFHTTDNIAWLTLNVYQIQIALISSSLTHCHEHIYHL